MRITVTHGNIGEQKTDAIILNLFEGVAEPGGATGAIDKALGGAIRDLIAGGDFTGKAKTTAVLYPRGALPAARLILVGLGKREDLTLDKVRGGGGRAPPPAAAPPARTARGDRRARRGGGRAVPGTRGAGGGRGRAPRPVRVPRAQI